MTTVTRRCPACGGEVHPVAGRCKHCKADLTGREDTPAAPRQRGAGAQPRAGAGSWRWILVAVAVALLAIGVSIGVFVERWRSAAPREQLEPRRPGVSPRQVPDPMPRPAVPRP